MGSISHGGHERGKRGDGDLTRARILESAGQLAAECGYANMTSKQVCERAHVNMAAVNYHFGSREGLYAAVLAEAHDRLFTLERLRQILAEGTAREKLSRTLDELLAHLHGPRSWHVRVLQREFFSPGGLCGSFPAGKGASQSPVVARPAERDHRHPAGGLPAGLLHRQFHGDLHDAHHAGSGLCQQSVPEPGRKKRLP